MNGAGNLADLQARLAALETELEVQGSILDDLQAVDLPGTGGPPGPPGQPRDEPDGEPVEPFYTSLLEFVTEGFAPVYCRVPTPTLRWCARWWDHAEAIYRLESLWRSWELYRLEPRLGMASWLRDYLDPQLRELTSPTGPFASCTDERHAGSRPLRTEQPPLEYLDDL
jgi:hypothetical protein